MRAVVGKIAGGEGFVVGAIATVGTAAFVVFGLVIVVVVVTGGSGYDSTSVFQGGIDARFKPAVQLLLLLLLLIPGGLDDPFVEFVTIVLPLAVVAVEEWVMTVAFDDESKCS
jgi:hypothetical protein